MKKLLIATFAVLAGGAAVDLARAAPVATPWSWTGFYVGGNVGYSWGNWDSTSVAAISRALAVFTTTDSPNVQGAVAGGQTGYIGSLLRNGLSVSRAISIGAANKRAIALLPLPPSISLRQASATHTAHAR